MITINSNSTINRALSIGPEKHHVASRYTSSGLLYMWFTYLTELRLIGRWNILCAFKSELAKTNLLTRFNCDLNRSNILCDAIALRSGPRCCYCLTQHEWEKIWLLSYYQFKINENTMLILSFFLRKIH